LKLHDLRTGWAQPVEIICHRDVPRHRWAELTAALAAGLNFVPSVEVACIYG
jgi:hypothetical protein